VNVCFNECGILLDSGGGVDQVNVIFFRLAYANLCVIWENGRKARGNNSCNVYKTKKLP